MAHGSKKWIRDYSGRIKRSTDRTRKDWKGDLHDWDYDHINQYGKLADGSPCPQCKGIGKDIRQHRKLIEKLRKNEGRPRYNEAYAAWERGDNTWNKTWNFSSSTSRYFDHYGWWNAFWDEKKIYPVQFNQIDIKTMLCHKCRFKYETERGLWKNWTKHGSPGWYGRQLNQQYRAEVKNVMARAKFDEEYYDRIPDQKSTIQYWW
jgi:hypothetical protein